MKHFFLLLTLAMAPWLATSQEYYIGGDVSMLARYEAAGVPYYDQAGAAIPDMLTYLRSDTVGWNALRVRLFVDPQRQTALGQYDPLVCQDLTYVCQLGRRIKAAGFAFLLDFHYSDTWADPAAQWTPSAWLGLTDDALADQLYAYTKTCLEALVAAGATPDFIQTGNEISYGMLWGAADDTAAATAGTNRCYTSSPAANWTRFVSLLGSATRASRDVCPEARIVIHTERSGAPDVAVDIYRRLASVDYDIIGLSYYPIWHGSLETLSTTLTRLAATQPSRPIHIVETAYHYQWQPAVGNGIDYDFSSRWPITPAGQAAYVRDLVDLLRQHESVEGLYWWFPEENGNGPQNSVLTNWLNRGLWDNASHRALPALYELRNLTKGTASLPSLQTSPQEGGRFYSLDGRPFGTKPDGTGIYIVDGRKRIDY